MVHPTPRFGSAPHVEDRTHCEAIAVLSKPGILMRNRSLRDARCVTLTLAHSKCDSQTDG